MNRLLQPPQGNEIPNEIAHVLHDGHAVSVAFNPRGNLLAVGTNSGDVRLIDFDVRVTLSVLRHHTRTVSAVAWSPSSRRLLSAAADGKCVLWDVVGATIRNEVEFETMCVGAHMHPATSRFAIVSLLHSAPKLIDWGAKKGDLPIVTDLGLASPQAGPSNPVAPAATATSDTDAAPAAAAAAAVVKTETPSPDKAAKASKQGKKSSTTGGRGSSSLPPTVYADWRCDGSAIILGGGDGRVVVLDAKAPATVLAEHQLPSQVGVKRVTATRNRDVFMVICTDRRIRMLSIDNGEDGGGDGGADGGDGGAGGGDGSGGGVMRVYEAQSFAEGVNNLQWKVCGLLDAYVYAGSSSSVNHNIFVWSIDSGSMVNIVEAGPKEGVMDLAWHPTRPIIASVSTTGLVYVWQTTPPESWSAYAPNFEELVENEEYVEREDEFDMRAEDQAQRSADESAYVDVVTLDEACFAPPPDYDEAGSGSDVELFYIPVIPVQDDQMLVPAKVPLVPKDRTKTAAETGGRSGSKRKASAAGTSASKRSRRR